MKKFGKYAASAPVGMFVLMTAGTSKAHAGSDTDTGRGFGRGRG